VETGGPAYPFDLIDKSHVAPPEVAGPYDQAVGAQWDASRDILWSKVGSHPPEIDAAIRQIMTFLAENELSALYLPSKFISRIHPAYVEVAMFLATQLQDEARHIDVFLTRARLAGGGEQDSCERHERMLSEAEPLPGLNGPRTDGRAPPAARPCRRAKSRADRPG